jgi:hypothetical protein
MRNSYAAAATALRVASPRRYTMSEAKNPQMAANVIHMPGEALSPVISMSAVDTAGVKPPNSAVARL